MRVQHFGKGNYQVALNEKGKAYLERLDNLSPICKPTEKVAIKAATTQKIAETSQLVKKLRLNASIVIMICAVIGFFCNLGQSPAPQSYSLQSETKRNCQWRDTSNL